MDPIGNINPPVNPYGNINDPTRGLSLLLTNGLRVIFVIAGILVLLNFVIAGFQYISAGGDAKAIEHAWARIWQSLVGLIIMVLSFALAAVFGYLIFGDATFMLQPRIYTP